VHPIGSGLAPDTAARLLTVDFRIRMNSEVQVLPGPLPAKMPVTMALGAAWAAVYRMTPHNCITFWVVMLGELAVAPASGYSPNDQSSP
jgi:hypothetical protein